MSPLTQSPFLQALGYSIVNSLWQFAFLWLVYVLINTVVKLSPHQKFAAGFLLQTGGFIWFAGTFIFCFQQYAQSALFYPLQKTYSFYIIENSAATGREKLLALIVLAEKLLPYLSVAYLVLLMFSVAKCIKAYNITQSVRTIGLQKIEVYWRLFVKQLSNDLGIGRQVKIYLSEVVQTPLTVGFLKPIILIPLASINHLNTDQMEAVILHELAHIKRFDYLFNLFLALIETTLFFNPFMLLISKHIKRERENCCDDWVLQYNYNAASYAGALLKIATCQNSYSFFALKAFDNKHALLNRVKRMIEKKERKFFNYRHQVIALIVMLTVLGSLALLSSTQKLNDKDFSSAAKETIEKEQINQVKSILSSYTADKIIAAKAGKVDKNQKKNVSSAKLFKGKLFSTNFDISNPATAFLSDAENTPAAFPDNFNENTENVINENTENIAKNIRMSNLNVQKAMSSVALKGKEIAAAEEMLKKLTINLLDNKTVSKEFFKLDQKKSLEEIKAALEQLRFIKLQSLLEENQLLEVGEAENNSGLRMQHSLKWTAASKKAEKIFKEMLLKMEAAKKSAPQPSKISFDFCFDNNYVIPPVINYVPSEENLHSFSFEVSTKTKAKVGLPKRLPKPQKIKNPDIKVSPENYNEFQFNIMLPPTEKKSAIKLTKNKNYYIVRI